MTDVGRDKALRAKIVEALDPFYPNPEAQCPIVIDALVKVLTPSSPVPGWVMVPREPTEEMLLAGVGKLGQVQIGHEKAETVGCAARTYKAMLSAAPVLTAPEGDGPVTAVEGAAGNTRQSFLATRIFNASLALNMADAELFDTICGEGKIDGYKFKDWRFDSYDDSIEFGGCEYDFQLSETNQALLWSIGFQRCWLNHRDGTEIYYWRGGNMSGQRKPKPPPATDAISDAEVENDFSIITEFFDDTENAELLEDASLCAGDAMKALNRIRLALQAARAVREK